MVFIIMPIWKDTKSYVYKCTQAKAKENFIYFITYLGFSSMNIHWEVNWYELQPINMLQLHAKFDPNPSLLLCVLLGFFFPSRKSAGLFSLSWTTMIFDKGQGHQHWYQTVYYSAIYYCTKFERQFINIQTFISERYRFLRLSFNCLLLFFHK